MKSEKPYAWFELECSLLDSSALNLGLKTSAKLPVVITWVLDVILALEIIWSSQNIWQQWKEAEMLNAVVSFSKRSEQMWNWKV